MTLLERIAANTCKVRLCHEQRASDSDVCSAHITDKWMHRLLRMADDTYTIRTLHARDESGWVKAA